MTGEQRTSKITYAGHDYTVPADQAQKVIDAMSSGSPTRVEVKLSPEQSLWLVVGPGIPVAVLDPAERSSHVYL